MPWRTDGGMTYWVDDNGPDGWQPTQPASTTHDPTGSGNGTTGFANTVAPPGGAAPAAPAAAGTNAYGDYDVSGLMLSANGHLFGTKRVISPDPNAPGQTKYDYSTVDLGDASTPAGLAAISAATTIPVDALTQQMKVLSVQNAQTQRQGNGSVIGANADGTITYYDRGGNIQQTADMGTLLSAGIQQSDVLQAQTDYQQRARTAANAGQYSAVSANPDGTISVKDFYDNITNVPADKASTMPGISPGDVQALVQQGNERNFLGSAVPNYGAQIAQQSAAGTALPGSSGGAQGAQLEGSPPPPPSPAPAASSAPGSGTGGYQAYGGTPASSTGNQSAYNAYMATAPAARDGGSAGGPQTAGGDRYMGAQGQGAYSSTPAVGGASNGYGYNASGFTGTQQGLQQTNQGMSNYYQYGQNQFNIAHQAQDQQNTAYKYNQTQVQGENAGQSRDLSGMGFAGIQKPSVAGY